MRQSSLLVLAIVFMPSCELAAKLSDRPADPIDPGCTWATSGDAFIRIADLRPTDETLDVCLRASGAQFTRPLLRNSGRQCQAGFQYVNVTDRLPVPSGAI